MTILVVLFHLAVIYEASTALMYYVEPPGPQDQLARVLLVLFERFNQAYFMGGFFLISGYFTPGSFDRKGSSTFSKDRLLRLGIPLVAYVLVLGPIASIGLYQVPVSQRCKSNPDRARADGEPLIMKRERQARLACILLQGKEETAWKRSILNTIRQQKPS